MSIMNESKSAVGQRREFGDVFEAELEEIDRRRTNAGPSVKPLPPVDAGPNTKRGLVGLAFSGGGIRSASFCLGVLQQLIDKKLLKHFDYLSTVSGGGFIGSCLSTLMHRNVGDPDVPEEGRHGEELLLPRRNQPEPAERTHGRDASHYLPERAALNHVRNGSNYLVPDGFLNTLRLPAVTVVGVLHTLLLLTPAIVLAVGLTEFFF